MKKKIIISIFILIFMFCVIGSVFALKNPRIKLLLSVVHFTENTLKDPSYLLYDIDIMEFIHDYLNAETSVEGDATLYNIEGLGFSVSSSLNGIRSLPKASASMNCSLSVIGKNVGDIELYANDQTVYFVVPMLNNMANAFPTGIDLFMRMPDLTSDINQKWFRDNTTNIITFSREIGIEETGNIIKSPNGRKSLEYKITIPEGCGYFIWDLLGMDYPDYDVVVSLYLTDRNCFRRMEIDLSDVLPGGLLVIDGEHADTGIFYYELPDDEKITVTMVRDGEHKNKISMESVYYTNTNKEYFITGDLFWTDTADGSQIKCKDVTIKRQNKTLATAYFSGTLTPITSTKILENASVDLSTLEELNWKAIRDDVDGFMDDMKDVLAEYQNK